MQDEYLTVRDGFVNPSLIANYFRGNVWSFGWKSDAFDRFPYWHIDFAGKDTFKNEYCESELHINQHFAPLANIWDRFKAEVAPSARLLRAYANGLTYGLEGKIHKDCPDHIDGVSAIIYANSFWSDAWGGETLFFLPDGTTRSVSPKPGRLVAFKGSLKHVARPVTRDCPALRVSLVFKAVNCE